MESGLITPTALIGSGATKGVTSSGAIAKGPDPCPSLQKLSSPKWLAARGGASLGSGRSGATRPGHRSTGQRQGRWVLIRVLGESRLLPSFGFRVGDRGGMGCCENEKLLGLRALEDSRGRRANLPSPGYLGGVDHMEISIGAAGNCLSQPMRSASSQSRA